VGACSAVAVTSVFKKKTEKIKRLEKKLRVFRFFPENNGKKKKRCYTKLYIFYAFRQSFAIKLGYYLTLGLDFQRLRRK